MNFDDLRARLEAQRVWRVANPGPLIWVTSFRKGALFRDYTPDSPNRDTCPVSPHTYTYIGRRMDVRREGLGYGWLRESPLANPYPLEDERDRPAVLERYRAWLIERFAPGTAQWGELMRILEYALGPNGTALACWCAPRACHGQVIRDAVLSMYAGGWRPQA